MAVRVDWKSAENLSYIILSFGVTGFIQFGIILFAYYFLPIVSLFILILAPLGATIINCGSAILFAEFFIQFRHKKIVKKKYKKPKEELTTGTALLISNILIIGMFLFSFGGVTYFYMFYLPNNQFRLIFSGFIIPFTNINIFNLPAFLSFMAADIGGAVAPFILAIIFDFWGRRPIKIKKRKF